MAENRFGIGTALTSDIVTAKHAYSEPGSPNKPEIVRATKDSVTLKWTEPANDGGSPIVGYQMEHKDRNSILWRVCYVLLPLG